MLSIHTVTRGNFTDKSVAIAPALFLKSLGTQNASRANRSQWNYRVLVIYLERKL